MKKNIIKIRLLIHGYFCAAEDITEIIAIQPTKTWKIGDYVTKKLNKKYEYNGWLLVNEIQDVDGSFDYQVEKVAERFLLKIEDKLENFSKLPLNTKVEFSCVIYANEFIPAIGFASETIKKLAKINAYIDVDLYDFVKNGDVGGGMGDVV